MAKKKSSTPKLPPHVESAMQNAGLGPDDRDERGLMPLAKAKKQLKGLKTVVRGKSHEINGVFAWDSDLAWAALLSLADEKELLKQSALDWKMPPRGLDNPGVAERYGDGAIDWVNAHLERKSEGPGFACLSGTVLAASASLKPFDCAVRLDAIRPAQLVLMQWLQKHPAGWRYLASGLARQVPDRVQALARLAKTDAKGTFAALERASDTDSARAAFESAGLKIPGASAAKKSSPKAQPKAKGHTPISIGAIEPHFSEFAYPMWDNANYFTGAMRVTGFACDRGEALVWEQLCTGLGEANVRREVTVHPSFRMKYTWHAHIDEILREREITRWKNGEDFECLLTGVKCVGDRYQAPKGGARKRVRVKKLRAEIPLELDLEGLSKKDAALLLKQTGPAERLLIRLGQPPYRDKVFPKPTQLAKEAGLPQGSRVLFSFHHFQLPVACEPASSSPDIVAMVDALAANQKLDRLPSHRKRVHPLAYLIDRIRALGGWGDVSLWI